MATYLLGKLQVRRGTSAERMAVIFDNGEPVYDIEEEEIYIGDGATFGGIPASKRAEVVGITTNQVATKGGYDRYMRFDGLNLTYTFDVNESYVSGREYHGRNVGTSNITIVESGLVINPPTEGSLIIPPGGTFTVKIVSETEADLFGVTEEGG